MVVPSGNPFLFGIFHDKKPSSYWGTVPNFRKHPFSTHGIDTSKEGIINIHRIQTKRPPFITHRIHVYPCMVYMLTNIWGILMVNVTIYSIHGSYGLQRLNPSFNPRYSKPPMRNLLIAGDPNWCATISRKTPDWCLSRAKAKTKGLGGWVLYPINFGFLTIFLG